MDLNTIKNIISSTMKSSSLHGKNIEIEAVSTKAGKSLAEALLHLATISSLKIKKIKKSSGFKDIDVVFFSTSDASAFYTKIQMLAKGQTTSAPMFQGRTATVSHKGNDGKTILQHLGSFGNWVSGIVTTGAGVVNNIYDSQEATAMAQAEAAKAQAEAAAAAEASKNRTILIAAGSGVLVLAIVLILALRK